MKLYKVPDEKIATLGIISHVYPTGLYRAIIQTNTDIWGEEIDKSEAIAEVDDKGRLKQIKQVEDAEFKLKQLADEVIDV